MVDDPDLFLISDTLAERYAVDEQNRARIISTANYDLSYITNDLNDDLIRTGRKYSCEQAYALMFEFGKCDYRLAKRLEIEFKRFCVLTLVRPGVPHAPPGAVDMYWHFFVLHTKEYIKFCEDVWGSFEGEQAIRHHFPSKDETRKGMLEAYKNTRALYVEIYGEPELYEMDGIKRPNGDTLPLASRLIWVPGSDTSGDSYSGIIETE